MTHPDPSSLADLAKAIAVLDPSDRDLLIQQVYGVSEQFRLEGQAQLAEVFFRFGVIVAEEQDHQRILIEHADREVEGVGSLGSLLSEDVPDDEPGPDGLAGGA